MSKKYILVVQGEGRGHMTQALSMNEMLLEQGHQVCAVILGSSGRRDVPKFFFDKIQAPIITLPSPNFIVDKKNKSINIPKSVLHNIGKLKTFRQSLKKIDEIVKEHQPDVIINFFDLLIGLYYRYYKPKPKLVCIGHQYIYFHPDFEFPKGYFFDKIAIKFYTKLTAKNSSKNLGLSFYNIHTNHDEVVVVPPLLRKEIFSIETQKHDYYLVYLVNNGYYEEIIEWHKTHSETELHCFTDRPENLLSIYDYRSEKLTLHAINDKLFLEKMAGAKGLASTAGFESVCEAMFLGKPVLMVPIAGHFEQFCNSRDAVKAGAGIFDDHFDLTKLIKFSSNHKAEIPGFKNWVLNAKDRIYNEIITV
jgi:uncharacterized protein (TIGR00661 family)